MEPITTIRALLPSIAEASALACQYYRQEEILEARFKADDTVVTHGTLLRRTPLPSG